MFVVVVFFKFWVGFWGLYSRLFFWFRNALEIVFLRRPIISRLNLCYWSTITAVKVWGFEYTIFRNARLFIILFVRNFWRVYSQFWLSVRNSVWGAFNRNSRGNPALCWLGGGGSRGAKIVNKHFVNQLAFPTFSRQFEVSKNCLH